MNEHEFLRLMDEESLEPVTPIELMHWQARMDLDEWYSANVYDKEGEPIDLRLLKEDSDDLSTE